MTTFHEEGTPVVDLLDVDQILAHIGGSGMRNGMAAFDTLYAVSAGTGKHSMAGETDRRVAPATFGAVLHRDSSDSELSRLNAQSLLYLVDNVVVLPGYLPLSEVGKVLLRLQPPQVTLGLVSQAMEGSAQIKFASANHDRLFFSGVCGSDSPDRTKIRRRVSSRGSLSHWVKRTVRNSTQVVFDTLKLHERFS